MLSAELFFGVIFFQLLFVFIQWFTFRRQEYGYYVLYIFCIVFYFTLKYIADDANYISISNFKFSSLIPDKSLSFLAFGIYIKFGRKFLATEKFTPSLDKQFVYLENGIIIYSIINFVFVALFKNFVIEAYVFALAFGVAFILSVSLLFRLYTISVYSKFLIMGSLLLVLSACMALYVGLTRPNLGIGEDSVSVYLQVGVIADFIFLNLGLVIKTKFLQNEALERQHAIALERIRISTELHDDVGGELSAIRLLSEMNTSNINPQQQLSKISASSNELVQKMNEIVWALNINNDTLQSLVAYMRRYTVKYLDELGISCTFTFPEIIADLKVDGSTRRNIFLLVKESVCNAVKHAACNWVKINIKIDYELEISIHDNGKGIPADILQTCTGNGLHNMMQRVKEMDGKMLIKNFNGTFIQFNLPLKSNTKR